MAHSSRTLSPAPLQNQARLVDSQQTLSPHVTESAPAVTVMTDFNSTRAFWTEPTSTIHAANDKMISCGVRLLFVLDSQQAITGLITATDILGEKPLKYISEHGGSRDEILVQDVMTPTSQLEAVGLAELGHANVGSVVEMMKGNGRQHMLVVASDGSVRGMFSTTQISRQLGEEIEMPMRANTFAELGEVIGSS